MGKNPENIPFIFPPGEACFRFNRFLYFIVLWLLSPSVYAQRSLAITPSKNLDSTVLFRLLSDFNPQPNQTSGDTLIYKVPDSLSAVALLHKAITYLHQKSHLAASADAIIASDTLIYATIYTGPALNWVALRMASDIPESWVSVSGFRAKKFRDKPFSYAEVFQLETSILESAENNGYPFASVFLDSIDIREDGQVSARLAVKPNQAYNIKKIVLHGEVKLPASYLPNFLGINVGDPYNRAKILLLKDALLDIPFLEPSANPTVTFSGNEATINLYLKKKRASRFDFIIGLLPRSEGSDPNNQRLLLTGSLNAAFQNALNKGERLSLEFERLRPETQKLDAQVGVPYLFGTVFGAEGRLFIFKRDSTWVDAQGDAGVQYLLPRNNYVRVLWENKSSFLQKIDTLRLLASRRLPDNLDFRQNGFGLETYLSRLDARFNPRKGWQTKLKAIAGFRRVVRNSVIEALRITSEPGFTFSSLYDAVADQRSTRFRLEGSADWFIPVFQRSTLKCSVQGGGIFSDSPVLQNEQYRLGGNKRLRGFNEESLFATRFIISTLEYRLLLGRNSFLAAFADWGYLENVTSTQQLFLKPLGLGTGLNFETKAGIFGITVAVGSTTTKPSFDLRAAKFHLGYVSLF